MSLIKEYQKIYQDFLNNNITRSRVGIHRSSNEKDSYEYTKEDLQNIERMQKELNKARAEYPANPPDDPLNNLLETNQKEYTPVEWVQKDREIGEKNLDIIIDRLNKDAQIENYNKNTGKTDMETWAEMYPGLAKRAYAKKVVSDARKEDPVTITETEWTTDQEVDDPAKIIDSYTPVEWVQRELESGDFSNIGGRDQSRLNPYGIYQKGTKTGVSPIGDSEVGLDWTNVDVGLEVDDYDPVVYSNTGSGVDSNQLSGTDSSIWDTEGSSINNSSDFLNRWKNVIKSYSDPKYRV